MKAKKFTKNGKEFSLKQDLADFQQWECGGDLFTVPKRHPTKADVVSAYNDLCDNDPRYGTAFQ